MGKQIQRFHIKINKERDNLSLSQKTEHFSGKSKGSIARTREISPTQMTFVSRLINLIVGKKKTDLLFPENQKKFTEKSRLVIARKLKKLLTQMIFSSQIV